MIEKGIDAPEFDGAIRAFLRVLDAMQLRGLTFRRVHILGMNGGLFPPQDIFLMTDCDTDSCLVGDNTELAAVLVPGTYYLAVDTFGSNTAPGGPYTLTLSAFWPGRLDQEATDGR